MAEEEELSTTMRIDLLPEVKEEPPSDSADKRPITRRRKVIRIRHQAAGADAGVGNAQFQALFQNIYEAALLTSLEGAILDVNVRARQCLLYDHDDLVGCPVISIISGADESLMDTVRESLESDRFVLLQALCLRKDGSLMPVEVSVSKLAVSGESHLCFLIRDITDRRRAEVQLRRTMANLAHSNSELEQFAYVVSHDLQEPLRKITTFGGMLKTRCGDGLSEDGNEFVSRMQDAASRMTDLIHSLLQLSRVTTRAKPFDLVDLKVVVAEVLSDLEGRLAETGGCVEVGDLPALEAERIQMRQLFQNLIGNALKYHRPDVPPVVKVYMAELDKESADVDPDIDESMLCRIVVEDNGIGFDDANADRIFGIFQRLHGRGEYEGTGIGLSVCRKIVERHGGEIKANGMPGEGAGFEVMLPLTQMRGEEAPEL